MNIEKLAIKDLGIVSKIIQDYIEEKAALSHLYKYKKSLSEFKRVIEDKSKQKINREVLSAELLKQYADIDDKDLVVSNIELLKDEKTFTVTTAHQLCLFTGPLYFIYKTISAIKLCKILKEEYPEFSFVPVFWMGSEDHDFEEINHLNLAGGTIEWERSQFGAVGKMSNKNISKTIDKLSEVLFRNEENELVNNLRRIFSKNKNYAKSYVEYLHLLFGQYGLVVLEQDNRAFKELFSENIKNELINHIVESSIQEELSFIDEKYKVQAKPRNINLFYMIDGLRERIIKNDNGYFVNNTEIVFSEKMLLEELKNHAERFSPNVLFRPLYQESILPNLAYVGGGGEIAYWLQLQSLFDSQRCNFPMLLLRDMGLVISKKSAKNIGKIPLDKKCLFLNKELLISELIGKYSSNDLTIENELNILEKMYNSLLKKVVKIDKSLERNILGEHKKAINTLRNIESKMLRAEKRNSEEFVSKISAVKDSLFPNGKLQERHHNFLPYYVEYGADFFDVLIDSFNPLDAEIKFIQE